MCGKHYAQMKRHGKIIQTAYTFDVHQAKDYQYVLIGGKKCLFDKGIDIKKTFRTLGITQHNYVRAAGKMYAHRLIMNPNKNQLVDHINGNTLDNRTSNLRLCTHAQNIWNQKISKTNKSGYKGVHWNKKQSVWCAQIKHKGSKTRHLGQFKNLMDAVRVREEAEKQLFGEFRYVNRV